LEPLRVSELDRLALVEAGALKPGPAAALLLDLARIFEVPEQPRPLKLTSDGKPTSLECHPQELGYGLLIVDRSKRVELRQDAQADTDPLAARLGRMLAKPAEYEAAHNDLGYLAFMHWYAEQVVAPSSAVLGAHVVD
jgi:hypothetical protein